MDEKSKKALLEFIEGVSNGTIKGISKVTITIKPDKKPKQSERKKK